MLIRITTTIFLVTVSLFLGTTYGWITAATTTSPRNQFISGTTSSSSSALSRTPHSTLQKQQSSVKLLAGVSELQHEVVLFSTGPIIVGVALLLGITAQGFINDMASGSRGLGAFLQDGKGFQGSGFSPKRSDKDSLQGDDPLPWLKLPNLEFVEVAGQQSNSELLLLEDQLEQLRLEMNQELERGNIKEATKLQDQLEQLMEENGFEYKPDS